MVSYSLDFLVFFHLKLVADLKDHSWGKSGRYSLEAERRLGKEPKYDLIKDNTLDILPLDLVRRQRLSLQRHGRARR